MDTAAEREVRGIAIRALCIGILEDVRAVLASPHHRNAESLQFRQDVAWVLSDRLLPFSFVTICDALGLEPGAVRRELRKRGLLDSRMPLVEKPTVRLRLFTREVSGIAA